MKITLHSHHEVIITESQYSHFQNEAKKKNEFTLVQGIVFMSVTSLLASLLKQRLKVNGLAVVWIVVLQA